MKRLLSTKHSAGTINIALLLLRIVSGVLIIRHGYDKILHFEDLHSKFLNFMGIGPTASVVLAIFAEFFCAILLIIGLFTRLASIPLIITMCVALFQVNHGDIFIKGEPGTLYLVCFVAILLAGPGRASVDNMIGK